MLSLNQPNDTNAAALQVALQNSKESGKFTFDSKNWEVGIGFDGASANKSLYQIKKANVDHLIFAWCLCFYFTMVLLVVRQKQMLKNN